MMFTRRRADSLRMLGPGAHPSDPDAPRIASVQWNAEIGGAETFSAALAAAMRRLGANVEVVFVTHVGPLGDQLAQMGVPFRTLGLRRGRDILSHPKIYTEQVMEAGRDGALLVECGYMGAALRLGGYRPPIVAVEMGILAQTIPLRRRLLRQLNGFAGWWADDVQIAVSGFMLERMRRGPHARRLCLIHDAIDPSVFAPAPDHGTAEPLDGPLTLGFGARLVAGKGADDVIAAVARARSALPVKLVIAGDGPERDTLMSLAARLGVSDRVEFPGMVVDMPRFWQECDVAVVPSNQLFESFGMSALEAMACAKPVVAARSGALPEVVLEGVTGAIFPPGDIDALIAAVSRYARDPELRSKHGAAGRARAIERFNIDDCARRYLRCFGVQTVNEPQA